MLRMERTPTMLPLRIVLLVVAVTLSGSTGVAQMSRAALVQQSDIIFLGTVTKVGAVASPEVPASPRTVVVRVDQVLEKPAAVTLATGDSVTVETVWPGSLKAGAQATFYTTGWIFGRGVAVREVGHEPTQSHLAVVVQKESVATARVSVNEADLNVRVQAAAMVVVGRVEQVRPAALPPSPARPKRITEHDPDWQEAIIHVAEGIKGCQAGERVVVRFPGSHDFVWVGTPRFAVGQEGTFLLRTDSATALPFTMLAGRSVPTYTALHRLDVLPKQDAPRVRALISKPS